VAVRAGPGRAAVRPRTWAAVPGRPVRQVADLPGSPVLAGRGTGRQAAVAFLQQIQIRTDAQFSQATAHPGGTQVQRPLLHVLPRRQHLIRGELTGDQPGVPGVFPKKIRWINYSIIVSNLSQIFHYRPLIFSLN
jgi:hypothetical protein